MDLETIGPLALTSTESSAVSTVRNTPSTPTNKEK